MPSTPPAARDLSGTLLALLVLLAWDATGADLALAHAFGTPAGFPLRWNRWFTAVLHDGARGLGWVVLGWLLVGLRWPLGWLRVLALPQRVQIVTSLLVSVAVVSLLKQASASSCPWDLQAFGGVARYVSHWAWGVRDGGPGGCFPAGHASSAFACIGGYFALRRTAPPRAWRWAATVVAAGLVLGLAQQMRGAHYMSHTLWTAWLCWSVALIIDTSLALVRKRIHMPAATAHAKP